MTRDRESMPARIKLVVFAAIPALAALALALAFYAWWRGWPGSAGAGAELNRLAWEASFTEFGRAAPPDGPREGYWGARLGSKIAHPVLGWHERQLDIPGRIVSDAAGLQRYTCRRPARHRVLILGGSVAWGASASSIETTYFHRLGRALEHRGLPSDVDVLAAGAWKSIQDIQAFRLQTRREAYDLVVFFNGLNDLTNGARSRTLYGQQVPTDDGSAWTPLYHAHDYDLRVDDYLQNMRRAADLAAELGVRMLIVLQPALIEKAERTGIEQRLLDASLRPHASAGALLRSYRAIRVGLQDLARRPGVDFLDCSRVFGDERRTLFSDMWHFSDEGHERLAEVLARRAATSLTPAAPRPDTVAP